MIKTKEDYKYYLEQDKKALGVDKSFSSFLNPYEIDLEIWEFQKVLRKCEYLFNVEKKNVFWKIKKHFAAIRFKKLSVALGFTINPNCFGPGLRIMHRGTIIVNGQSRIGANCSINACVNIGVKPGFDDEVPMLGSNIYIGPGAKIYGGIEIADDCKIGANAVVNKSFKEKGGVIIGVPARYLKKD